MNVKEMFDLSGEIAVVTGGTGIVGKYIAEAMAEAGARVIIASRNKERCDQYAAELNSTGFTTFGEQIDLELEDSIVAFVQRVVNTYGKIDILVNNSVLRTMSSINDPIEKWEKSLAVNMTGTFILSRTVLAHMLENKKGSIVNIGSIQGVIGPDLTMYEGTEINAIPDYFVHKHGLVGLTKFLAALGGPYNVRVNCISPGGFGSGQSNEFTERYSRKTYLRRMAKGEDIKGLVTFLASKAADYITGTNIPLDGGYTVQ